MINKESSLSALYFNKLKREISFEINRAGIITCIEANVESILGYKEAIDYIDDIVSKEIDISERVMKDLHYIILKSINSNKI